jgi:hypothetical protein
MDLKIKFLLSEKTSSPLSSPEMLAICSGDEGEEATHDKEEEEGSEKGLLDSFSVRGRSKSAR